MEVPQHPAIATSAGGSSGLYGLSGAVQLPDGLEGLSGGQYSCEMVCMGSQGGHPGFTGVQIASKAAAAL